MWRINIDVEFLPLNSGSKLHYVIITVPKFKSKKCLVFFVEKKKEAFATWWGGHGEPLRGLEVWISTSEGDGRSYHHRSSCSPLAWQVDSQNLGLLMEGLGEFAPRAKKGEFKKVVLRMLTVNRRGCCLIHWQASTEDFPETTNL